MGACSPRTSRAPDVFPQSRADGKADVFSLSPRPSDEACFFSTGRNSASTNSRSNHSQWSRASAAEDEVKQAYAVAASRGNGAFALKKNGARYSSHGSQEQKNDQRKWGHTDTGRVSRRGLRDMKLQPWLQGNGNGRTPLVIITDPGQDLDDEMTFILLRCLQGIGLVDVLCVVTNLHPSFKRALLCRGALDMLGMLDVPVGYGSDGGDTAGKHQDDFVKTAPYMPSVTSQQAFSLPAGRTLLYRVFDQAPNKSLSLCLISSLKDAALFLRDNEAIFVAKVKEVTIMGGVKFPISPGQYMQPDSAHNNEFDRASAEFFYKRCQVLGIPLIIVSRTVAYACPVPRQIYDDLAQSGSPIGWRLRNAQRSSIESLWKRASSNDPAQRMGLPMRCDKEWFKNTFCSGDVGVDSRGPNDPIWDMVKSFNMYDSIALIAAIPLVRKAVFTPVIHTVEGTEHLIIGASKEEIGISSDQADECTKFLHRAYQVGISLDHLQKTQVIISTTVQPNIADSFLGLALLRTLIETDTVDCLGIVISAQRYIVLEELEKQAAAYRDVLAELGLQGVSVVTQHTSIRENRLEQLYESAPPTGVRLLVAHALSDAAVFAMLSPSLFRDKTLSVVVLGGIIKPEADGDMLIPDQSCPKITADLNSARFFIQRCQELGVPLTVVSRSLSRVCSLPRSALDVMSERGGILGKRCVDEVKQEVEWIHRQSELAKGDPQRELPARCDHDWFVDTYCSGHPPKDGKSIWASVDSLRVDMPLMVIAAVPKITSHFFTIVPWNVRGVTHLLVGQTETYVGVSPAKLQELRRFLFRLIFKGILMNMSDFSTDTSGDVAGIGALEYSDCVPECVNVAREIHLRMQESVQDTFLSNLFASI
mmetsp:Transcript_154871/g.288799  ORF Transcript_154871/g.288799 Transcript_154871/m.288799 type:complete len:875 (-) Transcript_154871:69-2693(-)